MTADLFFSFELRYWVEQRHFPPDVASFPRPIQTATFFFFPASAFVDLGHGLRAFFPRIAYNGFFPALWTATPPVPRKRSSFDFSLMACFFPLIQGRAPFPRATYRGPAVLPDYPELHPTRPSGAEGLFLAAPDQQDFFFPPLQWLGILFSPSMRKVK